MIHLCLEPSLDSPCLYGDGANGQEDTTRGDSRETLTWPSTVPG